MEEPVQQRRQAEESGMKETIVDLINWYHYLVKFWQYILFFAIIGAVIGFVIPYFSKPTYTGRLTFVLEEKSSSSLGGAAAIASQFGFDLGGGAGGGAFSGDNIMDVLESRLIVEQALLKELPNQKQRQTLIDFCIANKIVMEDAKIAENLAFKDLKFPIGLDPDKLTFLQDSVMGEAVEEIIKENLSVTRPDKKKSVMSITCISSNQLFSKYFPEFLVEEATDFYIRTKTLRSKSNVNVLQTKTDSVRRELGLALYGRAYFDDKNLNSIKQAAQLPRVKKELEVQALTAMYTELVKNLELNKVLLMRETPLVQVIDHPILPLRKEKVGKAKSLVLGMFLGAFITCMYLIALRKWKEIMQ